METNLVEISSITKINTFEVTLFVTIELNSIFRVLTFTDDTEKNSHEETNLVDVFSWCKVTVILICHIQKNPNT